MSNPLESQRCSARSKRSGSQCKRAASPGATVCYMHGGAAPQVRAKAAQRLIERAAQAALSDLGEPAEPVSDPFAALERLAGEAVRLVDVLQGMVAKLEDVRYQGGPGTGTEQLRGELAAYMQALTRAESVLTRIVQLDLDSRRVRLREVQVAAVVGALDRVLGDAALGLDPARQRAARELLARQLGQPAAIEV